MDRRKPLTPAQAPRQEGAQARSTASRRPAAPLPPITAANSNTRVTTGRPQTVRGTSAGPVRPDEARPTNSNTRVAPARLVVPAPIQARVPARETNHGLNSERMRAALVARLRAQGITDERVLEAVHAIPRHRFIDEALASRAYEDAALPIGHGQTISQPWIVARMIAAARNGRELGKVLEVGTGCGYQAAVLAGVAREVYSIERIKALHELARAQLRPLRLPHVRLVFGDGMLGVPSAAPFDAIVVAAAGLKIPDALLAQLAVGGRLVAPEGGARQRLVMIERTGAQSWVRTELEAVRFVPLQSGVLL
ncbi:protein-L-isoaspartate(D-aspartate) O-methyltransferase [Pigmentiphaga kullae]|uniref:Protein-L-isoaspartate O-methyltransferase n=1 Tax=Pigmentiphaga kullae TaxID=151784 RepID=A0A4Q7NDK1_9BURK|nr:protein-L-isoaspartate(D-aspartate) O-methyltransferase [Pigmentiphaga kullae]RZS81055.1 protein-L-isoaspartate(D-aspartate) O-methyltransferase [Pigmentiphaga kullae]